MYSEDKLRSAIIASGTTPRQLSKRIDMPERTFYRKLKTGSWGLDEAKRISRECRFTKRQSTDLFLS